MRQVLIQVSHGEGHRVLVRTKEYQGDNVHIVNARNESGDAVDVVTVHLPNSRVGPFIDALEPISDLRISMAPTGTLTLKPPPSEIARQVTDVTPRSPIEVFVSGLQAIGSWKGFLGYAALAGVVVWLALITNTSFLLVAAMLIAPYAGPAMNTAIATARGDFELLWSSLARYFSALGVTVVTSGLLSLLFRQQVVTDQMTDIANISSPALLLPLAAGAAGALQLSQAERSSLVSGAAIGMLVAASLAPPAGLVGMGVVLREWQLVANAGFLLGLQLVGINLSGTILFRLFGLKAEGARYTRGRSRIVVISLSLTVVVLGGLAVAQFGSDPPTLKRSTLSQRARETIQQVVVDDPEVRLVDSAVSFPRSEISGQNTLLVETYLQRSADATSTNDEIQQRLTWQIRRAIEERDLNVTPLVDVTVLEASRTQAQYVHSGSAVVGVGERGRQRLG